jgi:hypothetical protein
VCQRVTVEVKESEACGVRDYRSWCVMVDLIVSRKRRLWSSSVHMYAGHVSLCDLGRSTVFNSIQQYVEACYLLCIPSQSTGPRSRRVTA